MLKQRGMIALTTPETVKQASLLYEYIALLEADADYPLLASEEDRQAFGDWCIERVRVNLDETIAGSTSAILCFSTRGVSC